MEEFFSFYGIKRKCSSNAGSYLELILSLSHPALNSDHFHVHNVMGKYIVLN